ncbi:MAG TPA: hypothetical protein GX701_04655 [Clostridiales bacterium]|nr:hypothetical protein [Clostridiales bacterium]
MTTLLLGRFGSGKTTKLMQRIAQRARNGAKGQILLVPEQSGFITERRLAQEAGNGISLSAEVLTFKSLATRVFSVEGGLACTPIDTGGQLLLLRLAAEQVKPLLKIYARHAFSAPFLQKAASTINELKLARIPPEELVQWGEKGLLGDKLYDLSLLYGAYEALCSGDLQDPSDRMTLLATVLEGSEKHGFFANRHVYIDGFTQFNKAEWDILRVILQSAASVTVSLCCDTPDMEVEGGVFAPVRKTAKQFISLCKEEKQPVNTEIAGEHPVRFAKSAKALSYLERVLAGAELGEAPEQDGSVGLYRAKTPYSEWEYAAGEILRLARQGVRFGEIAVATRDLSRFADTAAAVFARYGVPFFLDRRESAADMAPLRTAVLALQAAQLRRKEELFALLKTGFVGLSPEEADALENYALLWDLSPLGFAKPFKEHPEGFGEPMTAEAKRELARLNAIRARFIEPLSLIKKQGTAKELGEGLYRYLCAISLPDSIAKAARALEAEGNLRRAQEYDQLWALLCDALDQVVMILGDARLSLEEFAELFALLLSQKTVGSIPATLDAVAVGEAGRMRPDRPKYLLFLGAVDGVFPPEPSENTVLTLHERRRLAERGLPFDKTIEEQAYSEQLTAYQILTAPSEGLFISYYEAEIGGEGAEPSYYIEKIRQALPNLRLETETETAGLFRARAKEPCVALAMGEVGRDQTPQALAAKEALSALSEGESLIEAVEQALLGRRGPITEPEIIGGLYGKRPLVTASRLETYHGCPFSYFAKYGLGAKPRKKAELGPADAGNLIHYVLSETAAEVADFPGGWKAVSLAALMDMAQRHTDAYIHDAIGGLEEKSARFVWQVRRISESIRNLLSEMRTELSQSLFEPYAFELAFGLPGEGARPGIVYNFNGAEIQLAGKVDRVDRWQNGEETYLRVVDYKTGLTTFSFADVEAGLGAQMLVYLFALCKTENAKPAGVLYVPALSRYAQGTAGNSEVVRESAKRTGLLLYDPAVLAAMEIPSDGKAQFIPVSYTGSGEKRAIRVTNALANEEEFALLQQHVEGLLEKMAQGLFSGEIECAPLTKDAFSRCDYCDMRRICQFDAFRKSDRPVWIEKLNKKEFFEKRGKQNALDGSATGSHN